jgi:hypothetical protein
MRASRSSKRTWATVDLAGTRPGDRLNESVRVGGRSRIDGGSHTCDAARTGDLFVPVRAAYAAACGRRSRPHDGRSGHVPFLDGRAERATAAPQMPPAILGAHKVVDTPRAFNLVRACEFGGVDIARKRVYDPAHVHQKVAKSSKDRRLSELGDLLVCQQRPRNDIGGYHGAPPSAHSKGRLPVARGTKRSPPVVARGEVADVVRPAGTPAMVRPGRVPDLHSAVACEPPGRDRMAVAGAQ